MSSVREMKDRAADRFRGQKYREAAELLESLVKLEPGDLGHRLRLGDVYRKLGDAKRAIEAYQHVGRKFAEQGQALKAISAFKLILEMEPAHESAKHELSEVTVKRFPTPAGVPAVTRPPGPAAQRREPAPPLVDLIAGDVETELPQRPQPVVLSPPTMAKPGKAGFGPVAPVATDQFINLPAIPAGQLPPPPPIPLFEDLPPEAMVGFVTRLVHRLCAAGDTVIEQGEPGHSLFIIVEGAVKVVRRMPDGKQLELARLGEGSFFGEMALLSGAPRLASVVALEDTEVLEVSDGVLRELVQDHPAVATSLKKFYRDRLIAHAMAVSPLFKGQDAGQREAILSQFKMRQAPPDHTFLQEGEPADGMYLVLHGQVRVTQRKDAGRLVEVARLHEGDLFGLASLLAGRPAAASVVAVGPVLVLKLPARGFQSMLVEHPHLIELATASERPASNSGLAFV